MDAPQTNVAESITITGPEGAGPITVTPADDGLVHVGWPEGVMYLDAHAADDLIHAVLEAMA